MLLEDVREEWNSDDSVRRVAVDRDGRFRVGGLRPGEAVLLSIWTGGREKASNSWRRSLWRIAKAQAAAVDHQRVELPFIRPSRVRARVVDDMGAPVERFEVDCELMAEVFADNEVRPIAEQAHFPGGHVEWRCVAPDPDEDAVFYVDAEGSHGGPWRSGRATLPDVVAGQRYDLGDITLHELEPDSGSKDEGPRRSVHFVAMGASGEPLPLAAIEVYASKNERGRQHFKRADAQGRATLELEANRPFEARVSLEGHSKWIDSRWRYAQSLQDAQALTTIPAGDEDIEVRLAGPATAKVEILATYDGEPLPGASLLMTWVPTEHLSDKRRRRREATPIGNRTNGAGVWAHEGMLPGHWRARVFHPQLRMSECFDFQLAPGPNKVRLDRRPTTLVGMVVDEDGTPIEGALVRPEIGTMTALYSIHERDNHRMLPRLGGSKEDVALRDIRYVRTDHNGTFRLDGVEPMATLKALAMAPGYAIGVSFQHVAEVGAIIDLGEITMRSAGRIRVVLPAGMDGDVNIEAVADESDEEDVDPVERERWASIFGEEVLEGVLPGPWVVRVDYRTSGGEEDMIEFVQEVEVRAGETALVDLRTQ